MKRMMMTLVLLLVAGPVLAGPYFRIDPLSEIRTGVFFKPTDDINNINLGAISRVVYHKASDGYLILPGIDWDLLDVGWYYQKESDRGALVLGPSINLQEPVKKVLLAAVRFLPKGQDTERYTALRFLLRPGTEGDTYLAAGPAFGLQTANQFSKWKGHFLISATLNKRF